MKIGTAWRERMGDWASCSVGEGWGCWALREGGGHVLDQRGDEQKTGLLGLGSLGQVWPGEVA